MPEILAFSARQVCRLTGLSERQLSYWDRTGFFSPAYAGETRGAFARVYSFKDVVGLRALAQMRKVHDIPLQHLRQVGEYLSQRYEEPWSQLTFYIVGRRVYYKEQEAIRSPDRRGQTVFPFAMGKVEQDVHSEMARLRQRPRGDIGRITRKRTIASNRPILSGTRSPTEAIWNFYRAGYTKSQILAEYPSLTVEDVSAAIKYEQERTAKSA